VTVKLYLKSIHAGLESANWINLSDENNAAHRLQALRAALANLAVSANDGLKQIGAY